jgi:hypothetical protein
VILNKYLPLYQFLKNETRSSVTLQMDEIEKIISAKLPISASKYQAWWANGGHIQANAWLEANWKVKSVVLGRHVEFIKKTKRSDSNHVPVYISKG